MNTSITHIAFFSFYAFLTSCSPDVEKTAVPGEGGQSTNPKPVTIPVPSDSSSNSGTNAAGKADEPVESQIPNVHSTPTTDNTKKTDGATNPRTENLEPNSPLARFENATTDEERIALIKDLAASGSDALSAVVGRAFTGGSSESVAKEAARAASDITKQQEIVETLSAIIKNAESPAEAISVVEGVRRFEEAPQLAITRVGLSSKFPAVRQQAVIEIAAVRPKYEIDYIFPNLEDPDPAVRQTTNEEVSNLLGRTFDTGAEASQWWAERAHSYDEKMNLVTPLNDD